MSRNKLPQDAVDRWPEVLNDVDVNVVPLEYLRQVEVTFDDGKTWLIDIEHDKLKDNEELINDLEDSLEDLFEEYEDVISGVNFVVDVERVKKDIQKRTRMFLKKKK